MIHSPEKAGYISSFYIFRENVRSVFSFPAKQAQTIVVSTPAKQLNLAFSPQNKLEAATAAEKAGRAVVPAPLISLLHSFRPLSFIVQDKPHQEIKKHLLLFLGQALEQVNQFIFHAVPSSFKLSLIFEWR